ncbi:MAG TPA: glycosyltransferase [Methanoregulaceae archaeon]|nr:glycosyltransferase [Methanoregulaceae archaeon]
MAMMDERVPGEVRDAIPDSGGKGTRDLTLLIITPDYPDENDRYIGSIYVKNQVAALRPFFQRIVVICPVFFSLGILPNDKYCSDYQYDNVSVYYPRCFFIPRSLSIPLVSARRKMAFDRRYAAVRNTIRKHSIRFDLIHAHFTYPSSCIGIQLKEEFPVPLVATLHEDSAWLAEEIALHDPRIERAWREADTLIRVNSSDLPLLQRYNPRVVAVPNGFASGFRPLDKSKCRRELGLPPDPVILFTFGDLLERKGFQYLIDAIKILPEQNVPQKDIRCYISGKGPYRKTLQDRVDRLSLGDKVTILPYIRTEDLPLWINSADLFVFPSLQESFGIVQIEALACGKPVIAARNVGSIEVIQTDDVGILCEPADAAALAGAIRRGLEKPWDAGKILAYARQYSWDNVVRRILEVYAKVLKGGG